MAEGQKGGTDHFNSAKACLSGSECCCVCDRMCLFLETREKKREGGREGGRMAKKAQKAQKEKVKTCVARTPVQRVFSQSTEMMALEYVPRAQATLGT